MNASTFEPCSPGCPGWLHQTDPHEVQGCDACGRFKVGPGAVDDEAAREAHARECGCSWGATNAPNLPASQGYCDCDPCWNTIPASEHTCAACMAAGCATAADSHAGLMCLAATVEPWTKLCEACQCSATEHRCEAVRAHAAAITGLPGWLTGQAWPGGPSWQPMSGTGDLGVFLRAQLVFPNQQILEVRQLQADLAEDFAPEWDVAMSGPDGVLGGEYLGADEGEAEATARELFEAWKDWAERPDT